MKLVMGCGYLLLIPSMLFALDPARSVFQYTCRSWTRENGLPANGINALAQSKDGFLWLGTQKGLVRFDGIEFKTFPLPDRPQFRSQLITTLASSTNGALWFGIQGGTLCTYTEAAGFSTLQDRGWDSNLSVISISAASDGSLWFGADKGAVRWVQGNTNQNESFADLTTVLKSCEGRDGRVWLGTADQGLYYWREGKLTAFPDPSLATLGVFAIAEDPAGRIWVGTKAGLRSYDSGFRPRELPASYTEVKALLVDRHGVVWIGTTGDGLRCYKDGTFTSFRKSDGLANDTVTSLFEDREGNLWIGTRDGLSQLSDVKFPIYSASEGLPGGLCHSVCASTNGSLWAATSHGVSHFNGETARNYSIEAGLSVPYVKQILEAKDGSVYLINGNNEIEVLSGSRAVAHYTNASMPTAFAEDSRGVVAAVGGELFRVGTSGLEHYSYNGDEPPLYWIRSLFSCRDGSILAATVNGIFRIKGGSFEHWSVENGLSDQNVNWVCEDSDGVVWAGLTTGISRLKGNRIENISRQNGLFDNFIYAIIPDDAGSLWINSSRGIFRVSRQALDAFFNGASRMVECAAYDGLEAVKTIDTSEVEFSGCKTSDGRIWFPSPAGVIMIDPANVFTSPAAPPADIQHVRANGIELAAADRAAVRAGKGELEFQYVAASFIAPQKVRFRYQLEGYDAGWMDAGFRRSAFYTNLKPGKYLFRVQACNADGAWSAGETFAIELQPGITQRAGFKVACGLLGIAALSGLYAGRVRHLKRKHLNLQGANQLLESRIQDHTRELDQQTYLLRTLIDHLPDNVFVKDTRSRIILDNLAHARHLGAETPEAVIGKSDFDFFPRELAEKFFAHEQKLIQSGEAFNGEESSVNRTTGLPRWTRTTKVPLKDRQGKIIGLAGINRDITARKEAELKLEALHKQLVEASRHAGMAEVATSVLHNVGNVLNSVNVSASVLEDKIKTSSAAKLSKVTSLFRENEADLLQFLARDGKARQIMEFLEALLERQTAERNAMLEEVTVLVRNIEHIKEIVVMQQTYAKVAGVAEVVKASDLMEDAFRMHALAYERHHVRVIRDFADLPPITVDRHKAIQILVNLLQNAKYACDARQSGDRQVTLRTTAIGSDRVKIEVSDNGIGIPPENLTRIFSHGFTTRKGGHGFGLHSGALAAKEMGGSLSAHSQGTGKGSTFTLELPLQFHQPDRKKSEPAA